MGGYSRLPEGQDTNSGLKLWRVAASGSDAPERLELGMEAMYSPVVSPGGNLACTRFQRDENVWRIERSSLFVVYASRILKQEAGPAIRLPPRLSLRAVRCGEPSGP